MIEKGQVTIHIEGKYGSEKLSPNNYDVTLMQSVLGYAIALLELDKRKDRVVTTFHVENGSVSNVFTTSKQKAAEFAAVLAMIANTYSLDVLDSHTAVVFEQMQDFVIQNDFKIDITTSESKDCVVHIAPDTHFLRSENLWADAEMYYYGTIVDAGGKQKSNIHLDTKDGLIKIDADKDILANIEGNPLYRKFGVRVSTKQNLITGDIDKSNISLIEIIDFEPKFDIAYLQEKIDSATPTWAGIDADEFLHKLREGSYGEKY